MALPKSVTPTAAGAGAGAGAAVPDSFPDLLSVVPLTRTDFTPKRKRTSTASSTAPPATPGSASTVAAVSPPLRSGKVFARWA